MTTLSFVELLAQALRARGVTHVFGMPGGATLPFLEAFRAVGIEFVLVRHEGSAGFMADAAFHITRKPGVCIATLGPGATNLVSGVAGSLLERSKVVAITNQIGTELRGRYTHQILDQVALFKPVARRVVHLQEPMAAMQILTALAALDRKAPGPVVLDVPAEVTRAEIPDANPEWGLHPRTRPIPDVQAAAERLRAARNPIVVVGCGEPSIAAANGVRRLVQAADAVALTTYRAAGMADDTHPLWAGTFGLSPVVDAHQRTLFEQSDLMIAVGLDIVELRPQWLPGWPEDLPIISIDAFGQPDLLGNIVDTPTGPVMETIDALREAAFGPAPEDDPDAIQHTTGWTPKHWPTTATPARPPSTTVQTAPQPRFVQYSKALPKARASASTWVPTESPPPTCSAPSPQTRSCSPTGSPAWARACPAPSPAASWIRRRRPSPSPATPDSG